MKISEDFEVIGLTFDGVNGEYVPVRDFAGYVGVTPQAIYKRIHEDDSFGNYVYKHGRMTLIDLCAINLFRKKDVELNNKTDAELLEKIENQYLQQIEDLKKDKAELKSRVADLEEKNLNLENSLIKYSERITFLLESKENTINAEQVLHAKTQDLVKGVATSEPKEEADEPVEEYVEEVEKKADATSQNDGSEADGEHIEAKQSENNLQVEIPKQNFLSRLKGLFKH